MTQASSVCAIIMSSAYLSPGLVAEFGLLPPSFLPLANKRLYAWQIEGLKPLAEQVVLTVPNDFVAEDFDQTWLTSHGVSVASISSQDSLGRAIASALAAVPADAIEVIILFGDTLIGRLDHLGCDTIAVGQAKEFSHWGRCIAHPDGQITFEHNIDTEYHEHAPVLAGCFRFNKVEFLKCLTEVDKAFFSALSLYASRRKVSLWDVGADWYDFGHVNGYFQSRQSFITAREFNDLRISKRSVHKAGENPAKIVAEAAWYEALPTKLRAFIPNYLGRDTTGYIVEYQYSSLLSDLYVYGRLPEYVWEQIIDACEEALTEFRAVDPPQDIQHGVEYLYGGKTNVRMQEFAKQRNIDLGKVWHVNGVAMPSLEDIYRTTIKLISPFQQKHAAVMHGDFHFANMFFDFRSLGIKLIDPRGMIDGPPTIFGDTRYDVAKLAHSIWGLYDFILADIFTAKMTGDYELEWHMPRTPQVDIVQRQFMARDWGLGLSIKENQAMVVLLFISMLPLHADNSDHQNAMLANVFRLYREMVG